MQSAQKKNALKTEKFWFRKDITTTISPPEANKCCKGTTNLNECDIYTKMTVNEIINGKVSYLYFLVKFLKFFNFLLKEGEFPGLIPLINNYLSGMDVDADTHCTIQQYLKFIQKRASGDILTAASWIRAFVTGHPEYK